MNQTWATKHSLHLYLVVRLIIRPWYFHISHFELFMGRVVGGLHVSFIYLSFGAMWGKQVVGVKWKQTRRNMDLWILNPDLSELLVKGNSHRLHCVCVAGGRSGNVAAQTMLTCEKSGTQWSKNSIKKQTCSSLIKLQSLLQMAPSTNTGIRLPDTTSSRNFGNIQIEEVCESAIL